MPFIPHTDADVSAMLASIGVDRIETLFDEIPPDLRSRLPDSVPLGCSELEMLRHMQARAAADAGHVCFIGAGCYDHHVPAAVWDLVSRGEFMTAYTPYQAEASQGTLQVIYEYQSMLTALTGMDVCNASVYDGGSGLAEAILMAVRANKRAAGKGQHVHRVLLTGATSPLYRAAATTIVRNQGITLHTLDLAPDSGITSPAVVETKVSNVAAVVIAQPNFFGRLEDVDALTDWAHAQGALVIAVVNPMSLSLLKSPREWGRNGADIVCGDGQPFGIPMASGGPTFGFLCARMDLVRQMPGRIIGRTLDRAGRIGYTLTLQAREQHIRRAKATSNICTNQGLLVTAGTIYLAIMGARGLADVAHACHANTEALAVALTTIPGVRRKFAGPVFHELVLELPQPPTTVLAALAEQGIAGGYALGEHYPALANCVLVCATEKRSAADIERYATALRELLAAPGSGH